MTYEEYQKEWRKLSRSQYALRDKFIDEYNEKYKEFKNKKVEAFESGVSQGVAYFCGFRYNDYRSFSIDAVFYKVKKDGSMSMVSAGIYICNLDKMELKLVEE